MDISRSGDGLKKLKEMLAEAQKKKLQIGFFDSSTYPDGTPVAYVAAIQEFGSGPIPARPFIRPTIAEQRQAWLDTLSRGYKAVVNGTITMDSMLNQVGSRAAGEVKIAISKVQSPPLSITTLLLRKRKKSGSFQSGGKAVGEAYRDANSVGPRPQGDNSLDVSGVSEKPLVDTGYMISQVQYEVSGS